MGEKTEKATPKKLRDARKKGQVAKSQDLPSAFTFIVSLWACIALGHYMFVKIGGFVGRTFSLIAEPNLGNMLFDLYMEGMELIFVSTIPILAMVSIIGVIVNFLAVGPVFSFEVFKPDIKKFDPVQNLKSKFKLKTLFELVKSLIKVFVAGYLIYGVMYKSLPVLITTVAMPLSGAFVIFNAFLLEVIIKVGLFFIVVAVLDFIYQLKNFDKEMKMEKFEVKQEYKNTEGDPQIKSRHRQFAQEIAYQEGPTAGVKRAQAVVTNPTHLAIAVGYRREMDAAPYILAMGKDLLAERIVKAAEEYEIPVVRNIKLAHKLWQEGEVYEFIPEDTYEIVAEILRWVSALGTETEYDYSESEYVERF